MNGRENMLATIHRAPHDHVSNVTNVCMVGANAETFEIGPWGGGYDGYGVNWIASDTGLGASLPAPGSAILEDVTEWKKIVKFPDITKIDWEGMAREQLKTFDPENQVLDYVMMTGPFMRTVHLMGFEDALISFVSEPEACSELFNAITDYRINMLEYIVKYYKPDMICIGEDFATDRDLFMSPQIYRDLLKPCHERFNEAVKSYGIVPSIHICGKCDTIVPDLVDIGTGVWEICEPSNDLVKLQESYKNDIVFYGGYNFKGPMSYGEPTEEELRQSVRDAIDKYAPAGNFALMQALIVQDPAKMGYRMGVLIDEAIKYGHNYYRR